jgi:hypothetical protein
MKAVSSFEDLIRREVTVQNILISASLCVGFWKGIDNIYW